MVLLVVVLALWAGSGMDSGHRFDGFLGVAKATWVWEVDFPWKEAMFYETLADDAVQCQLCFRNCVIPAGEVGFCRNRENIDGRLYTLVYGRPSALHVDPVEKEPLHHFLPGSDIYCIGTAGCNFRCSFCHNWTLSQRSVYELGYRAGSEPRDIVRRAVEWGVPSISFTYNEPTTAYEFLYDVAVLAQEKGIRVIFHTNGGINPEPLQKLLPYVDAVTVDLKGFSDDYYRRLLQAELEPVLQTLQIIYEAGVWLEIVNLVVPGENDDPQEIAAMARWIVENLGPEVPLHFSRFFPNYRLTHISPTPIPTLEQAWAVAREAGMKYVSVGNVPGHPHNSTFCPDCGSVVIERMHFAVQHVHLDDGACSQCGYEIAGVWQ